MTIDLTEEQEKLIGERIAQIFMLKKCKGERDRYKTTWGTKSALGLYRMFRRIADDAEMGHAPDLNY